MKRRTKKIKRIRKTGCKTRKKAVEIKTAEAPEPTVIRDKKRGDAFTVRGSTSRLQEGMVIIYAKGKTFSFQPEIVGPTINISPNSECEIVRWQKVAA